MLLYRVHLRVAAAHPSFLWNGMHRSRSLIVCEVRARLVRLVFLRDTLEGLAVLLLIHESTGLGIPLCPVSVDGILDLGAIPDGTMAVAVAFGRISGHVQLLERGVNSSTS